jgi:integrase
MRQGELLALRWQDVDFTRRVICVENSLYDGQLCPTKSYGRREIRMVNELVEALLPLRNNGSAFVFPAQDCGPLHPKTLGRPLARAIKRSGVKRIRFHDLRHTAASHLVMAGVPIKTVQEILGHSDLAMTLRYAHLTPETREEAMVRLEEKVLNERRSRQSRSEVASEADANAAAGVSRT